MPQVRSVVVGDHRSMHEGLVEHLATVGATALAARHDAAPAPAAALTGEEPHVRYLARVVGTASTSGRGRVASLDARRARRVA